MFARAAVTLRDRKLSQEALVLWDSFCGGVDLASAVSCM